MPPRVKLSVSFSFPQLSEFHDTLESSATWMLPVTIQHFNNHMFKWICLIVSLKYLEGCAIKLIAHRREWIAHATAYSLCMLHFIFPHTHSPSCALLHICFVSIVPHLFLKINPNSFFFLFLHSSGHFLLCLKGSKSSQEESGFKNLLQSCHPKGKSIFSSLKE